MGIPLFFLLGPDASAESWGSCLWREQNRKSRETSRHLFFLGCEALYEEEGEQYSTYTFFQCFPWESM